MGPVSVGRFPHGLFLLFVFVGCAAAQSVLPSGPPFSTGPQVCCISGLPAYLGAYSADGKFRPASSDSYRDEKMIPSGDSNPVHAGLRPREVPAFVNLHPIERVVENYQPPEHAVKAARKRFFLAGVRDDLITLVYGRERALLTPQHLTEDSQGRIIVSDPGLGAVHILGGRGSFRIMAGEGRRLHVPGGVAVDADDNIYVTDPDQGVVVVFDRKGNYLREIGKIGDESLFHEPTAVVIDQQNGRLYLLDTPRDTIFVLDLQGKILRRVGKVRGHVIGRHATATTPMELDEPTDLTLNHGRLAVLDADGSRIHIMNLQCEVLEEFRIRPLNDRSASGVIGLGMDSTGSLYVSDTKRSGVKIYSPDGHFENVLGHFGSAAGEFNAPSGLWIDAADRMYIADRNNSRVQIFQLPSATAQVSSNVQ
jgi:sugar lactone lactonase YvrE